MRLKSIAPHFVVPDVVGAAEHYRDKLGFEILGYFAKPPVFAMVRRDGLEIHFGKAAAAAPGSAHREEGVDAYIWVDGVDALYAELKTRGAENHRGPRAAPLWLPRDRRARSRRVQDRVRAVGLRRSIAARSSYIAAIKRSLRNG